ncbi:MAG: hypothetical protein JWM11_5459 [Planctomycetaceae bacterium]|nr:hypothetical protein [Planctomycetaceae bacterium]
MFEIGHGISTLMKGAFSMQNRCLSGFSMFVLAFVLTGVAATCQQGQSQDKKTDPPAHNVLMQSCARACSDCQRACDMCSSHCATMLQDGKKEHFTTLMTCRDCATVCSAAAQIVARGGPFSKSICIACADTCSACAKECQKTANESQMKSCADECLKCERACREMIAHVDARK